MKAAKITPEKLRKAQAMQAEAGRQVQALSKQIAAAKAKAKTAKHAAKLAKVAAKEARKHHKLLKEKLAAAETDLAKATAVLKKLQPKAKAKPTTKKPAAKDQKNIKAKSKKPAQLAASSAQSEPLPLAAAP